MEADQRIGDVVAPVVPTNLENEPCSSILSRLQTLCEVDRMIAQPASMPLQ